MDLLALWHGDLSQARDWTYDPCIGRQILSHWTTWEAPSLNFLVCNTRIVIIGWYLHELFWGSKEQIKLLETDVCSINVKLIISPDLTQPRLPKALNFSVQDGPLGVKPGGALCWDYDYNRFLSQARMALLGDGSMIQIIPLTLLCHKETRQCVWLWLNQHCHQINSWKYVIHKGYHHKWRAIHL